MKETKERQAVKKEISDKIRPWHKLIQVKM